MCICVGVSVFVGCVVLCVDLTGVFQYAGTVIICISVHAVRVSASQHLECRGCVSLCLSRVYECV